MSTRDHKLRYQQWKADQKINKLQQDIQEKKEELKRITAQVEERRQGEAKESEQWRQVVEEQQQKFQEAERKFKEQLQGHKQEWKQHLEDVERERQIAEEEERSTELLKRRLDQQALLLQTQRNELAEFQLVAMQCQEERKRNDQQQRTIGALTDTIRDLQTRLSEQKKTIGSLEVGKQTLVNTSTKVQEQLIREVKARTNEQKQWTLQVDTLQERLKNCRERLQMRLQKARERAEHHQEREDSDCDCDKGDDSDLGDGFEEFEIEEDDDEAWEEELREEELQEEERKEYDMVKLGSYLLQLLEESKKAIDIGRNRSTPHVEVLLSLWSVLPYRFVEEHLQVSKTTLSKYRKKRIATNTPHGTIPGSGAPSEERVKRKKQHWIHFDKEEVAGEEGLFIHLKVDRSKF
jgi:chromosome segregation ATPase